MPNHKLKYEDIKKFVESNSNCKLLSKEYIGSHEKLEFECACGKPFKTYWSHFKSGKRQCNDCGFKSRPRRFKITYSDIVREIEGNSECKLVTSKQEYEYEVINNRKSPTQVELKLLCGQCREEIFVTTLRRWRERRKDHCYSCSMKNRSWTYEQVKHYIEVESQSGCTLLSKEYNGVLEPLLMKCWCGEVFKRPFHQFKDMGIHHCGKHRSSVGEKIIMDYCDKHQIRYEFQYTFDDCKNEKVLPFDIAVFNNSGCLIMLIEYHGEQHYEPKSFGETNQYEVMYKFMMQQINDIIKKDYCEKNGIPLLIIPYWERDNIESILDQHLLPLVKEYMCVTV